LEGIVDVVCVVFVVYVDVERVDKFDDGMFERERECVIGGENWIKEVVFF
jgi:hypothetical protein